MNLVVVIGGSGFIGTNLVHYLFDSGFRVINYDISKPRDCSHLNFWIEVDILDRDLILSRLLSDSPDYIIHLAARTDLNEKVSISGYQVNIDGVRNVMDAASQLGGLKRIVIASSMLVCKLGYNPKSFDDYAPDNLYGESKVFTEKIVKDYKFDWIIVRPTSIWGPWFGEPYKNFFRLVIKGIYFNIPSKYASTKTYGYVGNACCQILNLMVNDNPLVKHNYFYLGDLKPINITDWAIRIRKLNGQSKPLTFPIWLLKYAAKLGDILINVFSIVKFPMNTFRYKNMTNNNIIQDLYRTAEITQCETNINLDDNIIRTLNWLKQNKHKNI